MRPVDADEAKRITREYLTDPYHVISAVAVIDKTPTLTQPNEPLTLEAVAEILAEQFGDECACNVNGNDEWLPMMCHYGDVCPDPPEHLGCWMELLRNKYRRPPERQGGDADHA